MQIFSFIVRFCHTEPSWNYHHCTKDLTTEASATPLYASASGCGFQTSEMYRNIPGNEMGLWKLKRCQRPEGPLGRSHNVFWALYYSSRVDVASRPQ